jgi:hypothetical protein
VNYLTYVSQNIAAKLGQSEARQMKAEVQLVFEIEYIPPIALILFLSFLRNAYVLK